MRRLLIVVDCQKDFIDGALGFEGADVIIPGIIERIASYKDAGDEVVYTLDTHTPDYMNTQEGKYLPVPHCIRETEGWQLEEAVQKALPDNAVIVEKVTFGAINLPEIIGKDRDIEEFQVVGVCTDICVISNAMILKAAFPEVPVRVIPACCAGVTPESHENALAAMRVCQIITEE